MKKIFSAILLCFCFTSFAIANAKYQLEQVNAGKTESLPNIKPKTFRHIEPKYINEEDIKEPKKEQQKTAEKQQQKKDKETKKSTPKALTNYQYDDINYKDERFRKYVQDNIDYSNSGSTKCRY